MNRSKYTQMLCEPIELSDSFRRHVHGIGIDSYSRMPSVLTLFDVYPDRRIECFQTLGEAWTSCDNIADYKEILRSLLQGASRQELDAMMCPYERKALDELPPSITIYRGCYMNKIDGLSWTLDEQVAREHPFLKRYKRTGFPPAVVKTTVSKERCVLKLDRDEAEIIYHPEPRKLAIEVLPVSLRAPA